MIWYTEILHNVLNFGKSAQCNRQIFSKWTMHGITKSCVVKDTLKVQDKPWDFHITKWNKRVNMLLDSTIQLTFK